ncbi:MAG: cupin domain-containing protein [Chloroflexota bacterium]
MDHPEVSNEEMMSRVIRFEDVQKHPIPLMFIDSPLEGHQRLNYAVIGDTASENDEYSPMLNAPHTFQIGMVYALPGNGPAWHTHDYVEIFMPMSGKWEFFWTNEKDGEAEGSAVLGQFDIISLPPGLWRRFEVQGDESEGAWIFAVLDEHKVFEGKDPYWAKSVEDAAEGAGFHADEKGKMVKPDNYADVRQMLLDKISATMKK